MSVVEEILLLFNERGAGAYFGERVSMSEHALQAALFAQQDGASRELVVAALLHDIGHLLADLPDSIADWRTDVRHEELGSRWLAERFGANVFEPVRLHVPAKRYLCATEAHYFAKLSPASVHTLELQGGPMSPAEVTLFETEPFFRQAVRVRQWDDQGKIAGLTTPGLLSYGAMIEDLARPEG